MKFSRYITVALLTLAVTACSDDSTSILPDPDPEPEEEPKDSPEYAYPEEYHEKMRTVPYPQSHNTLYINPAPLIIPQNMKSNKVYAVFALSSSPAFEDETTEISRPVLWNFWNVHHELAPGNWYWRFKTINASGNESDWSEPYSFTVTGEEPVFVTPGWDVFYEQAPRYQSRLYCFLDGKLPMARQKATDHPEYASLIQRASTALSTDYSTQLSSLYASHDNLYANVEYLYQAYQITQQKVYADKLQELLQAMLAKPCSSSVLYSDNFITSTVTYAHALALDVLGQSLPLATRRAAESFVSAQIKRFFSTSSGYEENHIFDNHFWQINFRLMFQSALLLFDRDEYPEAANLLEYLYELWTARAPASGFNRDGVWHNGTGYFTTNAKTLAVMPLMFSYVTKTDFIKHPWYLNAGQALAFTMPPAGANAGFGDGHEKNPEPNRQMASFADFLARETGDGYASWYASSRPDLVHDDWEMRLYRMCNNDSYDGYLPDDTPLLTWFKDAGEISIHSDLANTVDDLALGFRSSQYGSGSHTTSSQNAFNMVYGGKSVFIHSGYYQNFSDAHNLLWYRHSRSHNTVLIDGIGQPYSTQAYGRMLRAGSTANIAYALGDASAAYCGFTNDDMWKQNFKNAGVEENIDNGFGPTPLTKYYRHLVMLQPGIAVIYDELEASRAADWQWLLHSPVEFTIDDEDGTVTTENASDRVKCKVKLITSSLADMSQTSQFFEPPATQNAGYPDQWHFTAEVKGKDAVRVLAIIQPLHSSDDFSEMTIEGDTCIIEKWRITASMNPALPPSLHIENEKTGAMLDMGTSSEIINSSGQSFKRGYTSSTMIIDGSKLELVDQYQIGSRTN